MENPGTNLAVAHGFWQEARTKGMVDSIAEGFDCWGRGSGNDQARGTSNLSVYNFLLLTVAMLGGNLLERSLNTAS